MKEVIEALAKLDTENDAHWNKDGSPKLAVANMLSGTTAVTSDSVAQFAPGFSRTNPTLPSLAAEVTSAPDVPATAPAVPGTAPVIESQGDNGTEQGENGAQLATGDLAASGENGFAANTQPVLAQDYTEYSEEELRQLKYGLQAQVAQINENISKLNHALDMRQTKANDKGQDLYDVIQRFNKSEQNLPARIAVEGFVPRNRIDNVKGK